MGKLFGPKFDAGGDGYDYAGAKAAGLQPMTVLGDDKPHWPSRDPATGMMLKGLTHPTFVKAIEADGELGFKLKKKGDRYYTLRDDDSP
jgi:hypothetical protein